MATTSLVILPFELFTLNHVSVGNFYTISVSAILSLLFLVVKFTRNSKLEFEGGKRGPQFEVCVSMNQSLSPSFLPFLCWKDGFKRRREENCGGDLVFNVVPQVVALSRPFSSLAFSIFSGSFDRRSEKEGEVYRYCRNFELNLFISYSRERERRRNVFTVSTPLTSNFSSFDWILSSQSFLSYALDWKH